MKKLVLGALAGAIGVLAACGTGTEPVVRNVILISIDTLRADYLEPYGAPAGLTPNVARFAEESVVFEDAIAQATSTLPSHMSIFYSVHTFAHRAYIGNPPAPQLTAPVRALRDGGVATGAFVGGGQIMPRYGLDRGFGTYEVINTRDIDGDNRHVDRLGDLHAAAESFLSAHGNAPFFLFLHTYEPHTPYAPLPRHLDQARGVGAGGIGADLDAPLVEYEAGLGVPAEAWIADDRRLKYAAEIAYVDEFLGRLFETIERFQLAEDTLIILTADHGESLGERGVVGHNKFYTEQLRVPFIVRAPGVMPARTAEPVELIDAMPTIFARLGIEPPYPFEGRDLTPVLDGGSFGTPDRYRFSENKGQAAVLQGNWKVVFSQRDPNDFQLFDLETDPGELTDLADQRAAVAGRLIRAYHDMVAANASLAALFPRAGEDFDATLDEETRRQLRALGYLQ